MARQQRSTTLTQESTRPIARVALYARVSTLNNQDPEMQLAELREYAGRRGWQITEEFIDQGVSGCKESRPGGCWQVCRCPSPSARSCCLRLAGNTYASSPIRWPEPKIFCGL
jgi:hypothetical protein